MSSTTRTVTTQAELDQALADKVPEIIIDSPRGVWLEVSDTDSATVSAYGSATVSAYGSATVSAYDSATVSASKYVAIHLHSKRVRLSGDGHVIHVTDLNLDAPADWCDYSGVTVTDGKATPYKAVDAELVAGHSYRPTQYPIGQTVTAPDWKPTAECGNGLHFGATPHHANAYYRGTGPARYLEVTVDAATLVPLRDKAKAPSCTVVREVDIHGRAVTS